MGRFLLIFLLYDSGKQPLNYYKWFNKPDLETYINNGTLIAFTFITGLIILLGLFVYGGIDSLITALTNSAVNADSLVQLRLDSGVHGWISPLFVYSIFSIVRLISFLLIGYAFFKKSLLLKCLAYMYTGLVMLALLANLAKSPFAFFFLQVIIFHLLLFNVKINFKRTVLMVFLFVVLLIPIYLLLTNAENSITALDLISYRLFAEPNRVLDLYPFYYPNIYPFAHGMNIRLIHDLLSSSTYTPANIAVAGGQEDVTFNAVFIADAWVDFSYWGVIVQSFVLGLLLSFLDQKIFSKNNFVHKSLFAAILIGIFSLASTSLVTSLFSFGLLSIPLLLVLLKIRFR